MTPRNSENAGLWVKYFRESILPTMTLSGLRLQSAVGAPAGLCEAEKMMGLYENPY